MSEDCYLCHRDHANGVHLRECDECDRLICEHCAEVDYDCQGDPPEFVCTQWICDSLKGGCP